MDDITIVIILYKLHTSCDFFLFSSCGSFHRSNHPQPRAPSDRAASWLS